jgi:glyoxylase-like metal-dependent hydrolase (beta-lactamase superfamily II)
MAELIRKTFAVPPLGCNCSILGDPVTKLAVVVDPGGAAERILREVQDLGLTVTKILHTHAHFDHFLASGEMKAATAATLCLHQHDHALWDMLELQCRAFGVPYIPVPPPDYWLTDEEILHIGQVRVIALHTPGHTPGSMSFHLPAARIERSILERLYTLEDATAVVTGHGPETEIGWEKDRNQFVRA